jgi:hypothetical protein
MPSQPNDPQAIVTPGKSGPVLLRSERNRPDAAADSDMPKLWGAMRGNFTVAPGTDPTAGIFCISPLRHARQSVSPS